MTDINAFRSLLNETYRLIHAADNASNKEVGVFNFETEMNQVVEGLAELLPDIPAEGRATYVYWLTNQGQRMRLPQNNGVPLSDIEVALRAPDRSLHHSLQTYLLESSMDDAQNCRAYLVSEYPFFDVISPEVFLSGRRFDYADYVKAQQLAKVPEENRPSYGDCLRSAAAIADANMTLHDHLEAIRPVNSN